MQIRKLGKRRQNVYASGMDLAHCTYILSPVALATVIRANYEYYSLNPNDYNNHDDNLDHKRMMMIKN